MLNITSFKNPQVRNKILSAMQGAIDKGYSQYVSNRKGELYLRVQRMDTNKGRMFRFIDNQARDITELLYVALRG